MLLGGGGGLSELGLIDALEHVLFPEIQWAVSKVIVELTAGYRIRTYKCQRDREPNTSGLTTLCCA